ncbi:hypothetical protein HDU80_009028 [Chytriomyces hyalinus]|nr:hypothetical protein HDU80_009028 [Chytriomyces hyalinus]
MLELVLAQLLVAAAAAATIASRGDVSAGTISWYAQTSKTQVAFNTSTTATLLDVLSSDTIRVRTILHNSTFVEPHVTTPMVVPNGGACTDKHSQLFRVNPTNRDPQPCQSVDSVSVSETHDAVVIVFERVEIRVSLSPMLLQIAVDGVPVMQETTPLTFLTTGQTVQTVTQQDSEQYYGGGMQNGRFTHKQQLIQIERSVNWDTQGSPNASPFYASSQGYAVFRNTFAPGVYDFRGDIASATHNETRFDAFFFLSPEHGVKKLIDAYTRLTGRPFLPPMYGLEMGDSDCYLHNANRGERHTLEWSKRVADGYVDNDMPVGWLLVNDGYGCGYESLPETADMLGARNMTMGLWTESNLTNQPFEVSQGKVRVRKLDVAWIGDGYEFALTGCEQAFEGIEAFSDARGFVWTVEGWAGTQRCAVMWTGDQKGTWENVRFHIPTLQGSGLSGQAWTTGDIDGIWLGSTETYVRDLQHKVFAPVLMSMSGWEQSYGNTAPYDKQPWTHGEPYTSINRKYLRLRESLLPYLYSFAAEAHLTGTPPVRPLLLEYPSDPVTHTTAVQYQFLFGTQFLVAPVYDNRTIRDGIYFPEGTWIDYWNGDRYHGPSTVDGYAAPLETLPLFVKEGSIIPMWPATVNSFKELLPDQEITLDVFPHQESGVTRFRMYEDDKVTRKHRQEEYSIQEFRLETTSASTIVVDIGSIDGEYEGKPDARGYWLVLHLAPGTRVVRSSHRFVVTGEVVKARVESLAWQESATVSFEIEAAVAALSYQE